MLKFPNLTYLPIPINSVDELKPPHISIIVIPSFKYEKRLSYILEKNLFIPKAITGVVGVVFYAAFLP